MRPERPLIVRPIGFAHSPFVERVSAPRQPYAAQGAQGTIELLSGHDLEHALSDLERWDHIWVLFWFHLNEGWRPKVLPPRSRKRRGVFATRSPHRPNPIGLSVLKLEGVDGLTLRVRNLDLLDGTPVLDIKPYVPFADAIPTAKAGWIEARDPEPGFEVAWEPLAREQTRWLCDVHGVDLVEPIARALSLGAEPHPYRRIRRQGDAFCLAVKDWRARFRIQGRAVTVESIATGYRARELAASAEPAILLHRDFLDHFPC